MLKRVVYISSPLGALEPQDMEDILSVARERNQRDEITGLLVAHHRRFLQVLEGPADRVDACLARIRSDPRHERVFVLQSVDVPKRLFDGWAMGYSEGDAVPESVRDVLAQLKKISASQSAEARLDAVVPWITRFLRSYSVPRSIAMI